jgi:hypothetical protein
MDTDERLKQTKQKIDSMIGLPDMLMAKGTVEVGDPLTGIVTYSWKFFRDQDTKSLTLYAEWVDLDGKGNRVVIPSKLIKATFRAYDRLVTKSRSIEMKERIRKQKEAGTYQPPKFTKKTS